MRIGVLLGLLGIVGAPLCVAQEDAPAREAPVEPAGGYFVFLYSAAPGLAASRPLAELLEDERLQGHFAYMGRLSEEGTLVVGGPFKDLSGAMGVLLAADLEAARAIAEADPGVAAGAFTVQAVQPWHPSVAGCVEDRPW